MGRAKAKGNPNVSNPYGADYPAPEFRRNGCKVSWLYYEDRTQAEQAAKLAIEAGHKAADLGYDFGYCVPGTTRECEGDIKGLFEVCIP